MKELRITEGTDGCTFGVHVMPRSRHNTIVGLYGQALRVRVQAPPVGGRANQAVCALLAERLGVPTEAVEIVSGHTSRHKVVRVRGVTAGQVRALLG